MSAILLAAARTDVGAWKWTALPPGWVLTLIAIAFFLFARMLYRWERGRAGRTTRLLLAGLRTVVLLLVVLVLAGPYREEVRMSEERSHLVILVDTSGSMQTKDRYPDAEIERLREVAWPPDSPVTDEEILETSRLDLVRRVLGGEGERILRLLDERFALHVFAFDVDWRGLGSTGDEVPDGEEGGPGEETGDAVTRIGQSIRDLQAEGGGTDLGTVLQSVAGEFLGREDRRLAGVLLVTDGRNTAGGEGVLESLAGLGRAAADLNVTPIALGNASSGRNVRVERVRAMDWVLIEDDVVFETAIRHVGFKGLDGVRAEMTIEQVADAEGKPLATPRPYVPPEGALLEAGPFQLLDEEIAVPVRLRARMREAGTFRVSVRVELPEEERELDAIPEDDVATHELRVVDQRIKVLYVDNLPRYDLRFLGNWLTREPEPDPTRPEIRSRYEAQILQQSADPTVDQPHSPGTRALRTFPRTRRDLFGYDVLVLGDIDVKQLAGSPNESKEVLELIRDFVEEGGGLVLQAGENYVTPLGLKDSPLNDLLPILPRDKDKDASMEKESAFRIHLTDVGERHPIFGVVPGPEGGIASPEEVAEVWKGNARYAPYAARDWKWFWMYKALGGLRPGAVALARAYPDQGPLDRALLDETGRPVVVFATMPFGKGRVFFSALDSLWRIRKGQGDRFYGPFWDQVIRYLATYRLLGGNKRFKITTDKEEYFAGEIATVTITALDRDFEPVEDAWLDGVHVEAPGGEDLRLVGDDRPLNLRPEGAAPGTFRFYLPLGKEGTYRIWIRDTASADRGGGSRAERRVTVSYRAPELRQTLPDHELLAEVVDVTDGRLVEGRLARLYDLEDLAGTLPARTQQRVVDRRERTQWDAPWVLLLLVGLLGVEWALRKRWQMI